MAQSVIDSAIDEIVMGVFRRITKKIAAEAMKQDTCYIGVCYLRLLNNYIMTN